MTNACSIVRAPAVNLERASFLLPRYNDVDTSSTNLNSDWQAPQVMAFIGLLFCTTCGNLLPRASKHTTTHITCDLCETVNRSATDLHPSHTISPRLTQRQTSGPSNQPRHLCRPLSLLRCNANATTSRSSKSHRPSPPLSSPSTRSVRNATIRSSCFERFR